MIADLKDRKPIIHPDSYVTPTAVVVGSVEMKAGSSMWFNAVARGDCEQITIGENVNVQDGAVLHADPGFPLVLHKGASVGHNAMLHGCEVGENSLVGIGAVVLNGAKIGRYCLIAANTLVPEGMQIPDGMLVVGTPATIKRKLTDEAKRRLEATAAGYVQKARDFREHMVVRGA